MLYVSEVMSDNDSTRRKSDLTLYVYCILIFLFPSPLTLWDAFRDCMYLNDSR